MVAGVIRLTLPYPLSANRYWRSFVPKGGTRAITHLSTEATAFKRAIGCAVFAAGVHDPIAGRVRVTIHLYPHRPQDWQARQRKLGATWDDSVQCIDLDNASKVLIDALKGAAFEDDKWVRSLVLERMEPDAHGARAVVTIESAAFDQPQLEMLAPGFDASQAKQEAALPF